MTIFQYADPYVPGNYTSLEIADTEWPTYRDQGWVIEPPPDYVPDNVDVFTPSVFDISDLATDADLTNWESGVLSLAVKMNVLFGKRRLAKNFIKKTLLKRRIDPSQIIIPSELTEAATFKELELIYRDLSKTTEDIASQKAVHYASLFDSEMELIILSLVTEAGWSEARPSCMSIPLLRS